MTDRSRDMILSRRGNAIADLSNIDIDKFGMTQDEALRAGIYKVNAQHQIGIATSTEVGLSMNRYPVRVLVSTGDDNRMRKQVDTCISFWSVSTASNAPITFQRRPLESELPVANLYKLVQDIDRMLWEHWDVLFDELTINKKSFKKDFDPAQEEIRNQIYDILCLQNPTEEQKKTLSDLVAGHIAASTAASTICAIKVAPDAYLRGIPHGVMMPAPTGMTRDAFMIREVALTLMVNRGLMKSRNQAVSDGALTLAAYAVTSMFRYGLFEAHEHKEFITVTVTPVASQPGHFTISNVDHPPDYEIPEGLKVGSVLNATTIRVSEKASNIGTLFAWISGLMHYLFNHTTGGTRLSGPMLSVASMFGLIKKDSTPEEQEALTNLFYEAVHPVNKRAIANIFFPTAKVFTHGKMRGSNMYDKLELDAFAAIRRTPYPAGSHKAFVCTQALKKVCLANLAAFLPWQSQLDMVCNMCKDILDQGARSHIGSAYYTGYAPISQSASLDAYLPELARFMQTFHQHDSLSASPHLATDVAARSLVSWTNLLKDIKAKDISGVSAEVVTSFLATTGVGSFGFNPDDQATWAGAAAKGKGALRVLNSIFV